MGSLQAVEMAEMLSMEDAIAWHLRSNHYPELQLSKLQPSIEASQNDLEGNWFKPV